MAQIHYFREYFLSFGHKRTGKDKIWAILHLLREGRGEKFGFLENLCYSCSKLKYFSLIIEDGKTEV